jgi:glycosyltransferase involved in cell wall biosynthesis
MDQRPFVTIVIPTRNRASLLLDALRSLARQDYSHDFYEVIVIDDGSTDATARVALQFSQATTAPLVRLLRQPPRNQSVARNRGVDDAKGSLIAFLDDDELAPAGWLSSLVDGSSRYPDADCFGGPCRIRFEGRPPHLCGECWPGEGHKYLGDTERRVEWVAAGNMMIRRRAFERAGRFNESLTYGEEAEWAHRLNAAGGQIMYLPPAWILHRRTPDMLRLRSRLRKAFASGAHDARSVEALGRPTRGLRRIINSSRPLAHAVLRRCSGGLTQAAMSIGFGLEALLISWSDRRASCARRPT